MSLKHIPLILLILSCLRTLADEPLATADLNRAPAKAADQAKINAALSELQRHLNSPPATDAGSTKSFFQLLGDEYAALRKNLEEIRKQQEEKKQIIKELEKDF